MSILYKNMEKGHKIAIGTGINQMCRNQLISNNWNINYQDTKDKILTAALNSYFVVNALDMTTEVEKADFTKVLEEKIKTGIESFRVQKPTMTQIYRYIEASLKANETPKRIVTNEQIWKEIKRLEFKIETGKEYSVTEIKKVVHSNCYNCGEDLVEGQNIIVVHQYFYCSEICMYSDNEFINS